MRSSKKVGALVVLLACACASASATTYTFNASYGAWATPGLWSPPGTPDSDDTAIIPVGSTCVIQQADQSIGALYVYGTLNIYARLTFPEGSTGGITVDGTIQLFGGSIYIEHDVTVIGSGEMVVAGGSTGLIIGDNTADLTVSGGVTVQGSFTVQVETLVNNALFAVSSSTESMVFGGATATTSVGGMGTFSATGAGTMRFARNAGGAATGVASLYVDGGKVKFESDARDWRVLWHVALVTGKITFDHSFSTTGQLSWFSGGSIDVLAGCSAEFSR